MWRVARFAFLLSIGVLGAAQTGNDKVAFEAATIKPFPEGTIIRFSGCMGGPGSGDPGRINCEYVTLKQLLTQAYQVKAQEIFGPAWMDDAHFNVTGTLPAGANREQERAMLRNLLIERFQVVLHRENRAISGFALTVAKGGLKMSESDPTVSATDEPQANGPLPTGSDGFPILRKSVITGAPMILYRQGRARLQGLRVATGQLADSLSHQLDRIVVDETGLTGEYDITVNWTPEANEPGARQPGAQEDAGPESTVFMALEQQLGIKVVAKKVQRETVVVDSAARTPTEN
jgi:uncharacterized protein (TIGR03435 family)